MTDPGVKKKIEREKIALPPLGGKACTPSPCKNASHFVATEIYSFKPWIKGNPHTLILGSMPGEESLKRQEYYAHPSNVFWRIMGELGNFDYKLPYEARLEALAKAGYALWDVACSCTRSGSSDSDIRNLNCNDIESLLKEHRTIKLVLLNGKFAHKIFLKHFAGIADSMSVAYKGMPSTSPANAVMSFQQKLELWRTGSL